MNLDESLDGKLYGNGMVAAAGLLVVLTVVFFSSTVVGKKKTPPGPLPWPVVGNFLDLSVLPHRALRNLATKYGGFMYLRLGASDSGHDVSSCWMS